MTPPQRVSLPIYSSLGRHVDAVVVNCSPEFPSPRLEVVKRLATVLRESITAKRIASSQRPVECHLHLRRP